MSQFISVQLTKEAQRLLRQAERALEPRVLFGLIFELFDKLGPKAAGHVTKKTLAGQVLHKRTGELARAMFGKAEMVHGIPAIRVGVFRGPSTRYAGAQEWGATIRPKHAKALAVPTVGPGSPARGPRGSGRAVTPAGVSRFLGPRQYPGDLVYIPIKRQPKLVALLVDRQDLPRGGQRGGGLRAMQATYLLLRKVKIPARHAIKKGVVMYIPTIIKELRGLFREILRGRHR